jgi:hypothetical protein
MRARLAALSAHPLFPVAVGLLAVALAAPALGGGLQGDDWFHRGVFQGVGPLSGASPLRDLFVFFDGGAGNARLDAAGVTGWWVPEGLQVAFFRPLSALTHALDAALWPDSPALAHAHSLAFLGLSVGFAAALFRRVHGPGLAAATAALLFAVEDAHAIGAAWLANRNAAVAAAAGIFALWASAGRGRGSALLGLGGYGAALLAGESGVAALAFRAALVLGRPGALRALAPWVLLTAAWRLGYNAAGFGAVHSGLYVDPGREPLRFAAAAAERLPLLLFGQVAQFPVDAWGLAGPGARALLFVGAMGAVGAVAAILRPALRRDAAARRWGLGLVLACVPFCAAFPMERLLFFPSLGWAGLLGLALAGPAADASPAAVAAPAVASPSPALRALGWLHGPVAAALLLAKSASLPLQGAVFSEAASLAPRDGALARQQLVFLNGTDFAPVYLALLRWLDPSGPPAPATQALLWPQTTGVTVHRTDAHTLRLVGDDAMLKIPVETLLRDGALPFVPGAEHRGPGLAVTVEAVDAAGRATVVSARFDRPLDDPGLRFFAFTPAGGGVVRPPADGAPLHLPAVWPLEAAARAALGWAAPAP